jgi:outer membrane receptor protein involved in Fe transport
MRVLAIALVPLVAPDALASGTDDIDVEIPVLISDLPGEGPGAVEQTDLDLANVVQTAAKGVTTVQEAPAIVTVVTDDEIGRLGHRTLEEVIDAVPGWMRMSAIHGQFPYLLSRGTPQSTLFLHNGISLFDPMFNVPSVGRVVPVETIDRVEIVTGPGGVLWGANSFLGILNVITKDADDVDGVEVGADLGDGPGDRELARGYVMVGAPRLLDRDVHLFAHASFESYVGPRLHMPQHLVSTPLPQPNSLILWGGLVGSEQPRSVLFNFDGKLQVGEAELQWSLPVVESHHALTFPGAVVREQLPEDSAVDPMTGDLACPEVNPFLADGQPNPDAMDPLDDCHDQARLWRGNRRDAEDRYVALGYRRRTSERAGFAARAYVVQFHREFMLNAFAPNMLLEGGLGLDFDATSYRAGASFDGDLTLHDRVRLLYGGEAFHEWFPSSVTDARGGPGVQSRFRGPLDLDRLALACPRQPDPEQPGETRHVARCPFTIIFDTERSVLGAYASPQWRVSRRLSLDGGARVQAAPDALGDADYAPQTVLSAAAVVGLGGGWHAKLNYAEGFRPPVFNNTASNGDSIQIDGNRDLGVETSQAIQVEINGRVLRDVRALRELGFRADYSYTRLDDLIQIVGGRYEATGTRGIHSAELLAKLYLRGGHELDLAYTWMRIHMNDIGVNRAMPEHWFYLGGVFRLTEHLQATTALRVTGAVEDPNRLVEHRDLDPRDMSQFVSVQPTDLVLDRLPPGGELTAGLTWAMDRWRARLFAYNAFDARHYYPDAFHDYEPRIEFLPNPHPDARVAVSASYAH